MRKKILSIFIAFAMIISLMGIPAFAKTSPTVELKASQTTVVKNDQQTSVVISVLLHNPNPEANNVSGISFALKSNNEKLKLKTDATSLATEFGSKSATYNSPKFAAMKMEGLSAAAISESEVTLMTIGADFDADAPVGVYTLKTEEMKVSDTKANALYSENPTVSIKLVSEISGTQNVNGVSAPVKNADPVKTVATPTGTTATIEWFSVKDGKETKLLDGSFAGDTVYKAVINVKPEEYYQFANGVSFTVDEKKDWSATKQNDGSYNLTKTFSKTAAKSITKLEVTTAPNKTAYTHGDKFDTTGMVVSATYDDNSKDNRFTGYTVSYATGGKNYLKKGDTSVTLEAGEQSVKVDSLTVAAKTLSITGLEATDRLYNETTNVELTGGQLIGVVDGEDVTVTMPTTGTIENANVGNNKEVAVTKPTLKGSDSNNYLLADLDKITVNILKGIPSKEVLDAIKGYEGIYDGKEHDAVVIGSEANSYTVKYKITENGNYETKVPTVKNASDMEQVVNIAVSKDNYETVYMGVTAKVSPKELTASDLNYGGTVTKEYDGTVSCNLTKVNATGVNSEIVDVAGNAIYDNKNVGTNKTVIFKADGITTGNYRLAPGTALEINASITATDKYLTDSKFNTQNVVKGIGKFEEPRFVSEFNEAVKGTFAFTYNGEAKTKEEIIAVLKEKNAGEKASIGYTFTPTDSNYAGTKTGTISITMIDIEFMAGDETATADNAITVKNNTPVYGTRWSDIIALKNNIKAKVGDRPVAGTYTLSVDTDAIPKAGTAVYNVLFTSTDRQYYNVKVFTTDASVQVSQKTLTVAGAKAEARQYNGTTSIAVTGGTLNGVVGKDDVTLGGASAGIIESADAGDRKAVTVTGYAISGADADNYTLVQPADVTVNISKKELTIKNVTVADKSFDGTTEATVTKVEFEQTAPLPEASGYNATAVFADVKAGNSKDVTVKVTLNDKNYSLTNSMMAATANISKAAAVKIPTQKIILKAGDKTVQTIDFAKFMPSDAGELAYTAPVITGDVIDTGKAEFKDGVYKFTLKENVAVNSAQTIKITIKSENYADTEVAAEVKTTDKEVPAVTAENITVEYTGMPVSKDLIKGTHSVDGTFDWAAGVTAPTEVADSGNYEVIFTPENDNYEAIAKTIRVTITQAKVSGNLDFGKVNTFGKTLGDIKPADFTKLNVNGTFTWNDGDAQVIEQGKSYGWTFTPDDKNYAVLKGTVTPWAAANGGGGILPPAAEKPEITVDNAKGKIELSADGTTATITPNDGYEIDKVTVNGKEVTAADNKVTGLKTGDKVVVTFREKVVPEPEFDAENYVKQLKLVVKSARTSKKNIRIKVVSITDSDENPVDLTALKDKGYTIKYKYYRSVKKASNYKVLKTKGTKTFVNTKGKKGIKYYYKVKAVVYKGDKIIAQSALKQCRYTVRSWKK